MPEKAYSPIVSTDPGTKQFLRAKPVNASLPMLVTESGIVMEVNEEQPENAELPMLVTESGIVMEVKEEQPSNAELPMLVTEPGMTVSLHPCTNVLVAVSIMALQLSLLSYTVFPGDTVIEDKEKQLDNAAMPILVTELGIFMDVNLEQPENARSPMLVTESGIVIELKEEQSSNARLPMLVTESPM